MNKTETTNQLETYTDTRYGWYSFVCGITLGSLLIISSIVFHFTGFVKSKLPEYVQYSIMVGLLLFFQIKFRNEKLGGNIPFKTSFGVGTLMIIYSGALLSLYMYVFMKFIDDSVVQTILSRINRDIIDDNLSDDQVRRAIHRLKLLVVPSVIATVFFFFIAMMGSFFALMTSLFVKR